MNESNINASDILQFLQSNGIIQLNDVEHAMKKAAITEILKQHPYKITYCSGRWQTYVKDETQKTGRKKLAKSTEEKLNTALYKYYTNNDEQAKKRSMCLRQLYPTWLEYKRLHTNADTYISRINTDWKTYYLDTPIIDIPIRNLTKLKLDTWAHKLIKDYSMTKNQYYNVTVIMRQALLYAVDLEIIESSPFSLVKIDGGRLFRQVKKKTNETQVFLKEELKEIIPMAWEDFYNHTKVYELAPLAFLFQFQTGLRIGELCTVRYSDIENSEYLHVQRMLRRDTKEIIEHTKGTYGDRDVLLTQTAQKIIACAKRRQQELGVSDSDYIFSINKYPCSYRSIADLYTKYCHKLDIIKKSSHKSRKTYISSLIDGNVNLNTVRELVGHADERTTLRNYCFDRNTDKEKRSLIEKALD